MDEVIDDLISLESGFNDGGLDCMESNLMMQNNVSMNPINSYTGTLFEMWQSAVWSSFVWRSAHFWLC